MERSYLFAPGHNEKLLTKVFDAGADVVILDLEDAVPPDHKSRARTNVAAILAVRTAWVRINAPHSELAREDLTAVSEHAHGIRVPKVESAEDVRWVADHAPGKPLICAIESAKGIANAFSIAAEPSVTHLALGGIDLQKDLGTGDGDAPLQYVRSHLVVASRAAGIAPPIDSVYPHIRDNDGLSRQASLSRSLGFFGKSAIHPAQLPVIHEAFSPRDDELHWAREVLVAFEKAGGSAVSLPGGEFVDLPVAERARKLLSLTRDIST
ncbi:HpcH/HpaI aldolase/citrate lyase family protein [Rhodococcus sp. NPDC057014]|uniref:HpcH/HpaI aldolase/citrate lyase family protein n=1 Tax=Rhodococcus sp. NPDC057014 TaxID=3346000 RepID=UPI0036342E70